MTNVPKLSLWDDPYVKKTMESMDDSTKYKFQRMGEQMYGGGLEKYNDPKIIEYEAATKIKIDLRDGLKSSMLSDNERELFISVFGINSLDEYI